MIQRRVAVTGMGLVNPFGGDAENFFSNLVSGKSAISLLEIDDPIGALTLPAVQCHEFDPVAAL